MLNPVRFEFSGVVQSAARCLRARVRVPVARVSFTGAESAPSASAAANSGGALGPQLRSSGSARVLRSSVYIGVESTATPVLTSRRQATREIGQYPLLRPTTTRRWIAHYARRPRAVHAGGPCTQPLTWCFTLKGGVVFTGFFGVRKVFQVRATRAGKNRAGPDGAPRTSLKP